jgi:hypothetical protein
MAGGQQQVLEGDQWANLIELKFSHWKNRDNCEVKRKSPAPGVYNEGHLLSSSF